MQEFLLIILSALAIVVTALKYLQGVRLWHVFSLSAISLALIMVSTLAKVDPDNPLIASLIAEWIPYGSWAVFAMGLAIGLISLVRSYQYRGALTRKWQQTQREEFEARHAPEQRTWDDVL